MKKLMYIIIALSGLGLFITCEEELRDPKLDISKTVKSTITAPEDGSSIVLLEANANDLLQFVWSKTKYNLTDLEATKYLLQMDLAGNNFTAPYDLVSTTSDTFEIKISLMNSILEDEFQLGPSVAQNFEFRIRAFLNAYTEYPDVYSDVITVSLTPYAGQKGVYLVGGASLAGWDNTKAIPLSDIGQGRVARVEYLDAAGDGIKFLASLGAWTPQWGTDDTGTPESGPLVYQPDEAAAEPLSIPMGSTSGDYYIIADTLTLEYETYLTSGALYLLGDATSVGWTNTAALPMTEGPEHVFTITTNLKGGGYMKILEVLGKWAPQWGTDAEGTSTDGRLVYRPNEGVTDPPGIPGPIAGDYKITVDLIKITYQIEKP